MATLQNHPSQRIALVAFAIALPLVGFEIWLLWPIIAFAKSVIWP